MKKPEELAEEYADRKHNYNSNFPREVQGNYEDWCFSYDDFLAGYQAGQADVVAGMVDQDMLNRIVDDLLVQAVAQSKK